MIGFYEIMVVLAAGSPTLVFWIAVVVFAAVRLRRGGGRAERLIIAGSGLKIISNLLGVAVVFLPPYLVDWGYGMDFAVTITSGYGIFCNIVGMAGIICLVYAFWVKFNTWNLDRNLTQQI